VVELQVGYDEGESQEGKVINVEKNGKDRPRK
jgi:hypothetical protein